MPYSRYGRTESRLPAELTDRAWPSRALTGAPLWASVDLRDGNQALANPMGPDRKGLMFDLLVRMGFKDIEVGYPSASEADFAFVRQLVTGDRIPSDVTISVFTPARPDLIDRTFQAIEGVERAMVHLCHATACLWRDVVFGMSADEVALMAASSAEQVARCADAATASRLRFEYSPETFNVTELEFALRLSNQVARIWDASPDRPVTLNLPTTVETDSPNVFADQIEWMHRNLERRDSIILSVHPHNDRGTAVASAELAVLAGADRVEGTLFGNGERTGNVCLATLALNLFSQGLDPQLDFSDIDEIRRTVEFCNQMPVHARYPYAGELVYTAFSGTHQDAIAKGLAAVAGHAEREGVPAVETSWAVPYLPIDPADVGRTYESVVRINSQSGKGGIAHVLKAEYGMDLPRGHRIELAGRVQQVADVTGSELDSRQLWELFQDEYLRFDEPTWQAKEFDLGGARTGCLIDLLVVRPDGVQSRIAGTGADAVAALVDALVTDGLVAELVSVHRDQPSGPHAERTVVYLELRLGDRLCRGVGLDDDQHAAEIAAVFSALNRSVA